MRPHNPPSGVLPQPALSALKEPGLAGDHRGSERMVVEPSREPPKLKPALLSRSGIAPKLSGPTLGNLGKAAVSWRIANPHWPAQFSVLPWTGSFSAFARWFQLGCGGFEGAGFGSLSEGAFHHDLEGLSDGDVSSYDMAPRNEKTTPNAKLRWKERWQQSTIRQKLGWDLTIVSSQHFTHGIRCFCRHRARLFASMVQARSAMT